MLKMVAADLLKFMQDEYVEKIVSCSYSRIFRVLIEDPLQALRKIS
jgi:hypothetical protein